MNVEQMQMETEDVPVSSPLSSLPDTILAFDVSKP